MHFFLPPVEISIVCFTTFGYAKGTCLYGLLFHKF
jgi:hypothetical protein